MLDSFERQDKLARAQRHKVLKPVQITDIKNNMIAICVATDMSKTGMRILLDTRNLHIPTELLVSLITGGTKWRCNVVWEKPDEIAVRFVD